MKSSQISHGLLIESRLPCPLKKKKSCALYSLGQSRECIALSDTSTLPDIICAVAWVDFGYQAFVLLRWPNQGFVVGKSLQKAESASAAWMQCPEDGSLNEFHLKRESLSHSEKLWLSSHLILNNLYFICISIILLSLPENNTWFRYRTSSTRKIA